MKNTIKKELIENYIKENGLSKTAFCKLCKIGVSTLNKIYAGDDSARLLALFKIARTMNIRVHELFN